MPPSSLLSAFCARRLVQRAAIHSWNVVVGQIPAHRVHDARRALVAPLRRKHGRILELAGVAEPLVARIVEGLARAAGGPPLDEAPPVAERALAGAEVDFHPIVVAVCNLS